MISILNKFLTYYHTIRYLKIVQLSNRFKRKLIRKKKYTLPNSVITTNLKINWSQAVWGKFGFTETSFEALNLKYLITEKKIWNDTNKPLLWLYNLHYFDGIYSNSEQILKEKIILRWIDENSSNQKGVGWEPYPLSIRIINWIKFLQNGDIQNVQIENSLFEQALYLEDRIEYHLLANHLFENAVALVFAGIFFKNDMSHKWLKTGLRILDHELDEQFLNDGAHFELSPMYHSNMISRLIDLVVLFEGVDNQDHRYRIYSIKNKITKGIAWLSAMSHPDGEISFFNDCAFGIAPNIKFLEFYALGTDIQLNDISCNFKLLENSGYFYTKFSDNSKLILDLAKVGPAYQPGHAHADTLSFELSIKGQRIFVNSGTSKYGNDLERHIQRSTVSHNTVSVDNQNSSNVWNGFRVGQRARVQDVQIDNSSNDVITVSAKHDGYRFLKRNLVHKRTWHLRENSISIVDEIEYMFGKSIAHFHLHPFVDVIKLSECSMKLIFNQNEYAHIYFDNVSNVEIVDSKWNSQFGISTPNRKIKAYFGDKKILTRISW